MQLAKPVQLALAFLLAAGSAFRPSEPSVARGGEPTGPHIVFSGVRHRQQVILGETFPFAIEVVGFRLPDGKPARSSLPMRLSAPLGPQAAPNRATAAGAAEGKLVLMSNHARAMVIEQNRIDLELGRQHFPKPAACAAVRP